MREGETFNELFDVNLFLHCILIKKCVLVRTENLFLNEIIQKLCRYRISTFILWLHIKIYPRQQGLIFITFCLDS